MTDHHNHAPTTPPVFQSLLPVLSVLGLMFLLSCVGFYGFTLLFPEVESTGCETPEFVDNLLDTNTPPQRAVCNEEQASIFRRQIAFLTACTFMPGLFYFSVMMLWRHRHVLDQNAAAGGGTSS